MITKFQIKKELQKMGLKVQGNYVRKNDVKKLLNRIESRVGTVDMDPVKVDCLFEEISASAHSTEAINTYYVDYQKLPKCVQDVFETVDPVIDDSGYTVHTPTAFLRIAIITKDNAELDMEIHLGKLEKPEKEINEENEEDEKDEEDEDEYFKDMASEMKATFDWDKQDVYFEVIVEPEEIKESFDEWMKKINDHSNDLLGLRPEDISGDYRWRHLYDEGFSVEEAFESWEEDLPSDLYKLVQEAKK